LQFLRVHFSYSTAAAAAAKIYKNLDFTFIDIIS
jgi:hypothetical protein